MSKCWNCTNKTYWTNPYSPKCRNCTKKQKILWVLGLSHQSTTLSSKTPTGLFFFSYFCTVSAFWTMWIGSIGFICTVSALWRVCNWNAETVQIKPIELIRKAQNAETVPKRQRSQSCWSLVARSPVFHPQLQDSYRIGFIVFCAQFQHFGLYGLARWFDWYSFSIWHTEPAKTSILLKVLLAWCMRV